MESKAAEAASEDMEALKVERREGRKAAIKEKRTGNMLLKKQMFSAYSKMYLSSGLGHSVGEPLSKSGIAQRGGIESEEGLAHCRKFLPRQKILDSLNVVDGALNIIAARTRPVFDGEVPVPEKGDVVVLATGQRAEDLARATTVHAQRTTRMAPSRRLPSPDRPRASLPTGRL